MRPVDHHAELEDGEATAFGDVAQTPASQRLSASVTAHPRALLRYCQGRVVGVRPRPRVSEANAPSAARQPRILTLVAALLGGVPLAVTIYARATSVRDRARRTNAAVGADVWAAPVATPRPGHSPRTPPRSPRSTVSVLTPAVPRQATPSHDGRSVAGTPGPLPNGRSGARPPSKVGSSRPEPMPSTRPRNPAKPAVTLVFTIDNALSVSNGEWTYTSPGNVVDPVNGKWYDSNTPPPNGKRWLANGLRVIADCAKTAQSYPTINFGQNQIWSWWAHLKSGEWVPAAGLRQTTARWPGGAPDVHWVACHLKTCNTAVSDRLH
jgi:hypothetical protein